VSSRANATSSSSTQTKTPIRHRRACAEILAKSADRLRLYPDPVCADLRRVIAEIHRCSMDQIFVGNGSDEILALCVRAFVEHGGVIGYHEPSYSLYPVLASIHEAQTRPVRLPPDFSWTMPESYTADLFFLANPNAPTSIRYPREVVCAFCERFPGVVLIDEAYVDFAKEHCMDFALEFKNVLVSRTLSKSFSLAGLRVGYVIGHPELIAAFYRIKDSYNVSRLSQEIALAALQDLPHMQRNVERICRTRDWLAEELRKRGWQVAPSETNFLWARPPGPRSAAAWFDAFRRRKILVRYFPGPWTGEFLRITIATEGEMRSFLQSVDDATRETHVDER
jgi:histidinol-phosphate aminotransferase